MKKFKAKDSCLKDSTFGHVGYQIMILNSPINRTFQLKKYFQYSIKYICFIITFIIHKIFPFHSIMDITAIISIKCERKQ